ncbi:hypothetical protein K440DRAFT_679539 [Wilcoxina mikolae CBS 423.85]|nr:hypothetical protein K440DRAFT_679539 [Wilcoxina mikolae CBS 423.85]
MYLTTTILAVFVTTSVLAIAEPPTKVSRSVGSPVCNIEANYFQALSQGVDPDGPMPDDFDEETDTYISFSSGSRYSIWLSAQRNTIYKRAQQVVSMEITYSLPPISHSPILPSS